MRYNWEKQDSLVNYDSGLGIENSEFVKKYNEELLPDSLKQQFFDPM